MADHTQEWCYLLLQTTLRNPNYSHPELHSFHAYGRALTWQGSDRSFCPWFEERKRHMTHKAINKIAQNQRDHVHVKLTQNHSLSYPFTPSTWPWILIFKQLFYLSLSYGNKVMSLSFENFSFAYTCLLPLTTQLLLHLFIDTKWRLMVLTIDRKEFIRDYIQLSFVLQQVKPM